MIYGSQLTGGRRVNQLNGQTLAFPGFPTSIWGARSVSVVAVGANQAVLSVSGRGVINFAALRTHAAGGGANHGLRVTVDGRQIFSWTGAQSSAGICAVGAMVPISTDYGAMVPQPIAFVASLLVECTNPAGGANTVFLNYEVDQ